jgi:hypothetical protein
MHKVTARQVRVSSLLATLLLPAVIVRAEASFPAPRIGDTYEITLTKDSAHHGSNQSSGTSHDRDTIIERVIGVRTEGLDLEYDLPSTVTADDRARTWEYPFRVFKPFDGAAQLLNGPELEVRIDGWLKAAGLPRSACGHSYFTWNAFRIECDPLSVLKTAQAFDLRSMDVREAAAYQEAEAHDPGKLALKTRGADGAIFTVELAVDPDAFRRVRAESDVVVGEIMNKPVSLDEAMVRRKQEIIAGTIAVELETDSAGNVRRLKKVTQLNITGPDGSAETETVTETLERRLISRRE